jgi:hypothetical protein
MKLGNVSNTRYMTAHRKGYLTCWIATLSQCVVAVVKRLKVLATCREIW